MSFFNPTPRIFTRIIVPDLSYPGKFYWKNPEEVGTKNKNYYKGDVIILVDSNTISYAEWYAMALQTINNSITIGNQTLGADGDTSKIEFLGGFKTVFSGIGVFYPDYTETQRKGIKIDIQVNITSQGIREGRDEILERAIALASQ